jgi:hypothetical protein
MFRRRHALATHEPTTPPLVQTGTFAFLPSLGMRLAPEVLIQELYREVFYEKWSSNNGKELQLSPEGEWPIGTKIFVEKEKALLYAGRGRSKRKGSHGTNDFYAPLFPRLARGGWPRKQSEHLVREHLLLGPIAQVLRAKGSSSGDEIQEFSNRLVRALAGSRGSPGGNSPELFAAILSGLPPLQTSEYHMSCLDNGKAEERLIDGLSEVGHQALLRFRAEDPLADRIFKDLEAVLALEELVPRVQWLEVLKSFLRMALATWVLARTQITVLLRDWLIDALSGKPVPDEAKLHESLRRRYRNLFHPTLTPTDELGQHVDRYMIARIETNLLLSQLNECLNGELDAKHLTTSTEGGNSISLVDLLQRARSSSNSFALSIGGDLTPRQFATRQGELYRAWCFPRRYGVGKNLNEFLRVLKPGSEGDADRGYLVSSPGIGISGQIVFPGATLIKTFVFLAEARRRRAKEGMKLILADLEGHFEDYGVAFRSALAARPRLIQELIILGLLKGSPDAGDSAELRSPY